MGITVTVNKFPAASPELIHQKGPMALSACGLVAHNYAANLCPSKGTGNLRNSIAYRVDTGEMAMYLGASAPYATYVEMGTGKYVSGGAAPWVYPSKDKFGNLTFVRTEGQPPKPFIVPAIKDHEGEYSDIIKEILFG